MHLVDAIVNIVNDRNNPEFQREALNRIEAGYMKNKNAETVDAELTEVERESAQILRLLYWRFMDEANK